MSTPIFLPLIINTHNFPNRPRQAHRELIDDDRGASVAGVLWRLGLLLPPQHSQANLQAALVASQAVADQLASAPERARACAALCQAAAAGAAAGGGLQGGAPTSGGGSTRRRRASRGGAVTTRGAGARRGCRGVRGGGGVRVRVRGIGAGAVYKVQRDRLCVSLIHPTK